MADTSHLKVTGEWKTLWRLNIPNRVKLLLWRMMRGCLPVRTNLQRKRVSCPATCPLCDAGLENEFHIFFGCDHSIQCWQASGLWGDVERVASGSEGFQETMMSLLKNLSTQKKRESVMLMWALWKRKNVKVWDGVLNDTFETMCHARQVLGDWDRIHNKSNPSELQSMCWSPPQGDRLKCNCDASMFKELNSFGIGLCIRDEKGKFIRAKTLLHQGIPSAPEAEATGLLDAISWLHQLGLEAVDVEMDCKVVVDAVHGEKDALSKAPKMSSRASINILVIFTAVLPCLVGLSHAECDFKAIFNFGDSNSDTGGFYAAFPAESGPYGMTYFNKPAGRASDGRLIIDFLAQALGLPFLSPYLQSIGSDYRHGANYATLASTVLLPNTSLFVTGISPFSLAIQLNQMKQFKTKVDEAGQQAIGIGGVQENLPQVVSQIAATIKELYNLGGRTFMVLNLAPVGCYPSFLVELPHDSSDLDDFGCMVSYNNAVVDYNNMLKQTLTQTRQSLSDASVIYVDTYTVLAPIWYKSMLWIWRGEYNFDPKVYCGNTKDINGGTVTAAACNDPNNYVSWDGIHATEAANKLITYAILNGSYSDPPFPFQERCNLQPIG
ncbi:SGNH hydrolase superfamily [Sesbania bispinosa]|nr:SGNH hydrolase superfamily [Sesbania bispinosa]